MKIYFVGSKHSYFPVISNQSLSSLQRQWENHSILCWTKRNQRQTPFVVSKASWGQEGSVICPGSHRWLVARSPGSFCWQRHLSKPGSFWPSPNPNQALPWLLDQYGRHGCLEAKQWASREDGTQRCSCWWTTRWSLTLNANCGSGLLLTCFT